MAACVFDPDVYASRLLPSVGALKIRHLGSDSPVLHESEIRKRLGIFNFKGDVQARTAFIEGLDVGTVNIWEVPGYRIEMSPFGGIKDSGNGIKEGVLEAMKFFTNVKTYSLPWPV
jgi:acyl-CoA reductase-like NAD-dependent aldehyde dehydrogenase